MNNLFFGSAIFIVGVLVSAISQILLKTSAVIKYDNPIKEYLNPKVIIAYVIFFSATLCSIVAYRYIPLAMGPILESTGYVFVTALSYFILREKVNKRKLIGLAIIIFGVIIFSL